MNKKQQRNSQSGNLLELSDEGHARKVNGEFESVPSTVLDLFDLKYSCPMLSVSEQHDLFEHCDEESSLSDFNGLTKLSEFDENKASWNILRRLESSSRRNGAEIDKQPLAASSFMLHKWLYTNKDIKSNMEKTKSLKQIQPLLEETVQKKYTTSRMWESFQGPLTWQHFCRLAFRDSQTGAANQHTHSSGGSSGSTQPTNSSLHNGLTHEPEPIPALLVASAEKDWLAVSPYAIKFWDKLNLEPYSKQKNIAYISLIPEFYVSDIDSIDLNALFNTKVIFSSKLSSSFIKEKNLLIFIFRR